MNVFFINFSYNLFRLKSGWSVRTASARSPTNARQHNQTCASTGSLSGLSSSGLSEAEQEHIRKVLARAECGRQNEELRIGFNFLINQIFDLKRLNAKQLSLKRHF